VDLNEENLTSLRELEDKEGSEAVVERLGLTNIA
jgi:hypothetical protein